MQLKQIVKKTSHDVADCFKINQRGYLRNGYYADIVLINPLNQFNVSKNNILYKCGWSPFEGMKFSHSIESTFVNGQRVYHKGEIIETKNGERLTFDR